MAQIDDIIKKFEGRSNSPELWMCPRPAYAEQLRKRINSPLINQGDGTYLCGTASVVQQFMRASKMDFIVFAISLYETGQACISFSGDECIKVVKTSASLRQMNPYSYGGAPFKGDWVDWVVLSSVRADLSTQSKLRKMFPYEKPQYESSFGNFLHASALPADVAQMLSRLGFEVLVMKARTFPSYNMNNLKMANDAYNCNHYVNLFVNSHITKKYGKGITEKRPAINTPTHWIVLSSPINISEDKEKGKIKFSYIDYGSEKKDVEFPSSDFFKYYFGFIAASK